ncbi:MAG: hypothetical protein Q9185_005836 [Variospora sp. 1 TL-2023]
MIRVRCPSNYPELIISLLLQLMAFLADSRSLSLRPQCSSKAVVVVEFHPERGNIFILAFADATCAAYDAAYIFRVGVRGQRGSGASADGTGWEISHIKNLHRFGGTASQEHIHSNAELHESLTPDSTLDGDQGDGIVAVGFVPGHKTTVVTVGSDRRCCVVDFAASETHKANVIYIWDTARSLTSLSILTLSPEGGSTLPIAGIRDYDAARKINILAIGCEDGNVLFFDLVGTALLQQTLSPSGDRIIDVEWMEGDDWLEPSPRQSALDMPSQRQSRRNRRSVGAVLASDRRTVSEEVVTVRDSPPAKTRARTALTRTVSAQESPLGSRAEKLIDLKQEAIVWTSSDYQKDGPPLLKTQYPPVANHDDDSSGMGETSSSGSLGSMLRKFQFPDPPKHHESQSERVQRTGVGQIPRNNSWAADLQPHNAALRERPHNAPVGKRVGGMGEGTGRPPPIAGNNSGGPRYEAMISKSSASHIPFEPDSAAENNEFDSRFGMVKASDQADEDLWTDVVPDVSAYDQTGEPRLVDKENSPSRNDSNAVNLNPDGLTDPRLTGERTTYRPSRRQREPGTSFAIHIDDVDQPDHPQPLSAHPEKLPSSGPRRPPLVPTNMNSSHKASAARTPWYRQQHKTGNSESHRSSIYGPGALVRKVKQEVMITVNVELDVLRREMSGRFTDQSRWFEKELRKSQEWTLRVEEENRKLREEMAKERRRSQVEYDYIA